MRDGRRTETVTWNQLDDAIGLLSAGLNRQPVDNDGTADLLAELSIQAETMADIAGTLALERGDDASADMLFWARATRAGIESHRRDLAAQRDATASLAERLLAVEQKARSMALAMDFGFLLDQIVSCSRSDIAWPMARSTRAATICLPPRRGWQASWQSRRATFPPVTGSGSVAP